MAQRLRNGVVFLQGHDGEFTFLVENGLLLETHMLSFSFEKTFKRSKLTHQTSPTTTLSAPFAEVDGTKLGGFIERLCRRPIYQRCASRSHSGVSF